jgi:alpha-glucuronidase
MTPLGLHHIMSYGHHYGPAPWVDFGSRPDWNCTYYHRADSIGLGFDRTITGSNALSQYTPSVSATFSDLKTCPDKYLLWFHHVPWDYKMKSGRTLWDELCNQYYAGVEGVRIFQKEWKKMRPYIDNQRFTQVKMLLDVQEKEAVWWRNTCVLYFQTFSKMPNYFEGFEKPDRTLDYYRSLKFPYAPGN